MAPNPGPNPKPFTTMHQHSFPKQQFLNMKNPGPKMAAKKKRTRALVKRRYKGRVIVQPLPTTPTPTVPMNPIPDPRIATSTISIQNAHGEFSSHDHSGDCMQYGTGKI